MCAGFEAGKWRAEHLANHLLTWLPEFALNEREYAGLSGANAVQALRDAARTVYTSEKYQKRGEIGEILLHAVIRQEFDSVPIISKIFFKDSSNDTVKGFDAVHIVEGCDGLELWLGEVKFYQDVAAAIRDVVKELAAHTEIPYLRSEFAAIWRKIDADCPFRDALRPLLEDENTTMDVVFKRICIPVMIAYDSETVGISGITDTDYEIAITEEFESILQKFAKSGLPREIKIVLTLLPMNNKASLLALFDKKLKGLMA